MKIRVLLVNESTEVVASPAVIATGVDGGVLVLSDKTGWLATFGPGCWLSAVKVTDED